MLCDLFGDCKTFLLLMFPILKFSRTHVLRSPAAVGVRVMLDDGVAEYKMLSERALTEYSRRCLCPCCDFTGMTLFDYVWNYLALSYSTA